MVAKRANTARNHEFRIWNIFRREYTQSILDTQHRGASTTQRTTQRIRLHTRRTQRLQMAQTMLGLIATRHLRKLIHSSKLHLLKSHQLISRKKLLLILQTARRQIRQETLRHARSKHNIHHRQGRLRRQKTRNPQRGKLQIETIQTAQLQKTIQHTQRAGSKTVPRRRTHLISSLKNMAEHRKIQRHPTHTQRRRLLHQRRHHKLHHTIRRIGGAAHNIQRQAGRTPRDERQQSHHPA